MAASQDVCLGHVTGNDSQIPSDAGSLFRKMSSWVQNQVVVRHLGQEECTMTFVYK